MTNVECWWFLCNPSCFFTLS